MAGPSAIVVKKSLQRRMGRSFVVGIQVSNEFKKKSRSRFIVRQLHLIADGVNRYTRSYVEFISSTNISLKSDRYGPTKSLSRF